MAGYPQSPVSRRRQMQVRGGTALPPPDLGPVPQRASQPNALDTPDRLIGLPGANFPPAGAQVLEAFGDADIAAGATAVIVTVVVPDTYRFRVAGIGFSADDETSLRFLTWSVQADPPKGTVPGYDNMPASIGSVQQLSEVFILLGSSVIMTIVGTNVSLVPISYHFICRVRGWFYTERG